MKVKPGSGCERAGIEPGSKVIAVDGKNMQTKLRARAHTHTHTHTHKKRKLLSTIAIDSVEKL